MDLDTRRIRAHFPGSMVSYGILVKAAVETLRISIPTLVDGLLDRTDYHRCDGRLDSWSRNLVEQAKIRIDVEGLSNLDRKQSYVVMSNHQSHYDIPIVFQALGIPIRMVAKTELFRVPVMGPAMAKSGFVEVDRNNSRRAIQQMRVAKHRLQHDGLSIWIAPEGTRSLDGRMGEFKSGGFHLALATEARILPLSVCGSIRIHRSGEEHVNLGQRVKVVVHPTVEPADYGKRRLRELMGVVRERIESGLPEEYRSLS
jgi:1-acyl-sn-glycerol-3-phosphate acyltransferase